MIPKIIHYCWLSGDHFPELIHKCIQSWNVHLPDYKFVLWDREKADLINSKWLKEAIESKKYAFAADFIRIYALYNFGGIYLDADVEIIAPFQPFLNHDFFIGFEYNNDLEPAIFGSISEHPLLADLLSYYTNRPFIKEDGSQDIRPLPTIFNEIVSQRYRYKPSGKFQFFEDKHIAIYPYDFFSPKNYYSKKIKRTSNTVSIHHFDSSWVKKNRKYWIKRNFHQLLYKLGGKSFHSQITQIHRKFIGLNR